MRGNWKIRYRVSTSKVEWIGSDGEAALAFGRKHDDSLYWIRVKGEWRSTLPATNRAGHLFWL